jgi:NAD(P)-dependent dehydrogenase (short-subunit alcohol dehydrogenase family)
MPSLFALEGKRIVVLGGGLGMGEATVRLLASLGCQLAVVDIEPARAERVAADIVKDGGTALPFSVDVTDDDALVAAIARVERELGPLDGMAAIVGMACIVPLMEMSLEAWDLDQRRNLRYFFVAAREVARSLIARQAPGSLVCISSIDGIRSAPRHGAYGAAKAGLINLVKTMAAEWSPSGVRVNAVAPGTILTPRQTYDSDAMRQRVATLPLQRLGQVEDIAKAVAFFLSDLSPYVTGQTLAVDGGYGAVGVMNYAPTVRAQ